MPRLLALFLRQPGWSHWESSLAGLGRRDIFSANPRIRGNLTPSVLLLEYAVGSIDSGVHYRRKILHYLIHGDQLERIAPFVLSPREFVDEWLHDRWPEATHPMRTFPLALT